MKKQNTTTNKNTRSLTETKKKHLLNLKKKQLIGYSIGFMTLLVIIFFILFPVLQGTLHFLIVLSGSMSPSINAGDIVVTTYYKPEKIQVGDVITFQQSEISNKNFITHRVVNITEDNNTYNYQTKGDANNDVDQQLVTQQNLIGKVEFSIPYLGYLPNFVKTPFGFIIFIIIPGSLLITFESWKVYQGYNQNKKKNNN